jgi:hypothetical protein
MKQILITSAVAAGTLAIAYLIKRRKNRESLQMTHVPVKRSHHRTDIFAKAKEQAGS